MLFKDCKFKDKPLVRKNIKEEIMIEIKKDIPFEKCNDGRILEYIDLLLDESEYDTRQERFYYKFRWVRITLDSNIFSKIASEYINEHLDDFLLTKHRNN